MKIKDIRASQDEITGKLSDITRQLAFAGIAIIWIFRIGEDNYPIIALSKNLVWPLIFIILSLFLDLLHYSYSSYIHRYIIKKAINIGKKNDEDYFKVKEKWIKPTRILFWLKVVSLIIGYVLLIIFVLGHIQFN